MPHRQKEVDLDLILNKISDGISVHDHEWRFVYANERAAEIIGQPIDMIIGKTIWEVYPEYKNTDIAQACERARTTLSRETATISNPLTKQWLQVDIYPSTDSITFITRDVTKSQESHEERLQFMARLSEKLASSLIDPDVLQAVAELVTSNFADYCSISEPGPDGMMKSLAFSCGDPTKEAIMRELIVKHGLHSQAAAVAVVKSGDPLFVPYLSDEFLDASSPEPEFRRLAYASDLRSMIIVPLQSRGQILGAITFALKTGRQFREEDVEFARMLGRRIAAAIDNARLYGAALQEIEDRKRAENERAVLQQELDREQLRLGEIMRSIPGAVYEAVGTPGEADYKLEYISPYVEQLLGYQVEELASDPLFWVHHTPKEYRDDLLEQVRNLPPHTDNGRFSFKWQHKNGHIFDVEAHFRTRRNDEGNVIGRTGVVMDVTDRLRAEQELNERREQLARLMSNIPGMAYRCLTSEGWPFEYASSGCLEFTGYAAEDLLLTGQRRWFELIHPEDIAEIDRVVEDAIARNIPIEVTYRIRHASGEERYVLDRAVIVRDDSGEIIAFEGICIDITEIRRAQDAIMQANQAKDQFIAALSHELRTPLTPVLTCVEILKDDKRIPEELHPMMEIIERNIQLEARLIDDLLDLTRIIRGKVHLEKKSMDLHSLLLNAIDICSTKINEKKLDVKLELSARVTAVHCDPARIQQVLWNLLQNAAKFTPANGVITVKTWNSAQDELFVSIQDSGIGIEQAQLTRIFNPFEQGTPSITKRFGGLGLGLAISQRIVEMHSGAIQAFSEGEGLGATFTITLPIAVAETIPSRLTKV